MLRLVHRYLQFHTNLLDLAKETERLEIASRAKEEKEAGSQDVLFACTNLFDLTEETERLWILLQEAKEEKEAGSQDVLFAYTNKDKATQNVVRQRLQSKSKWFQRKLILDPTSWSVRADLFRSIVRRNDLALFVYPTTNFTVQNGGCWARVCQSEICFGLILGV